MSTHFPVAYTLCVDSFLRCLRTICRLVSSLLAHCLSTRFFVVYALFANSFLRRPCIVCRLVSLLLSLNLLVKICSSFAYILPTNGRDDGQVAELRLVSFLGGVDSSVNESYI
jgi:hypothetical protein